MKILMLLFALSLLGCESPQRHYSAQERAAWDAYYKKRGIGPYASHPRGPNYRSLSEPNTDWFAEQEAQQARDAAEQEQRQRESSAVQHIMQRSGLSQNEAEELVREAEGGQE
jgi:hypothetical protein